MLVSAKESSKVGKGEQRVLEPREAPAGKAACSQARKAILTGLTDGSHTRPLQRGCCIPNKPPDNANANGAARGGTRTPLRKALLKPPVVPLSPGRDRPGQPVSKHGPQRGTGAVGPGRTAEEFLKLRHRERALFLLRDAARCSHSEISEAAC